MSSEESFLSRWSRRKHRDRGTGGDDESAGDEAQATDKQRKDDASDGKAHPSNAPENDSAHPDRSGHRAAPARETPADDAGERSATPPLPPIDSLTPESDFRPFMGAGVDASTRNAALAQLFKDPQFSVMDGLDVYIDDYNITEPIPPTMLSRLERFHTIDWSDAEAERRSDEGGGDGGDEGKPHAPKPHEPTLANDSHEGALADKSAASIAPVAFQGADRGPTGAEGAEGAGKNAGGERTHSGGADQAASDDTDVRKGRGPDREDESSCL